ncbi:MAG: redoxin domain-containing protein [Anaerolineaceae bacterium]|nr:redoxin domain-containing protein [Anaerolineaceae bacterium]
MAQLRQDAELFNQRDTAILIVGPENAEAFRSYWQKHDLSFIGLPDPGVTVLKKYGQEVNLFKLGRMPAQVIVDKEGIARFVHYGHSMSDIPDNAELLDLLDKINNR